MPQVSTGLVLALLGALPAAGQEAVTAGPTTAALMPVSVREPAEALHGGELANLPSPEELEARGATVGKVEIDVDDIFNEDDPRENYLLYRWANDLKLSTRDSTVREQILFKEGEPFSEQKAEETARLLRAQDYLSEAEVVPTAYNPDTNTVDVKVRVRDVWTLEPGIGFGRSGGSNKTRIRIADENFFGFGQNVALEYKANQDRSSLGLQFHDPNLFHSWWGLDLAATDTSDGRIGFMSLNHPFYSLDSHWMAGFATQVQDEVTSLYDLGETIQEFDSSYTTVALQGGRSQGLVNGWTRRWLVGYRYDSAYFDYTTGGDSPSVVKPEDRELSYPWIGVEWVQDQFQTTRNQDQIGRTEDLFLGIRARATMGFASDAFGSNRSAGIFSLDGDLGRPLNEKDTLFLTGGWSGRIEQGSTADSLLEAATRIYHRFNEKNLFMASFEAAHAHALDLDHQLQLGGDNGLRGYPLRYQTGETRTLLTVEQRYFTNWFPFHLFRVGGAVFADVGRMWGKAPLAEEPTDWLGDVGFGLRLGNARSGLGSVLHLDLAFPLASTQDIDSMQVLIHAQKSF